MLLQWRHGVEHLFLLERAFWIAYVFAETLLLARLIREGLLRRYVLFAVFLTADVMGSLVLMQTDIKSRAYSEEYRICSLIMTIFRWGVAVELYERICEHFPGMGKFRAGMAAGLVLVAALATVFTFRPNLVNQWAIPRTIVLVMQRFQSEIFAAGFVLTWLFLRYVLSIRQPFQSNVLNHWRIAIVYFGVSGAGSLAALFLGRKMAVLLINNAVLAAQLGCLVAWIKVIRRSGEEHPPFYRLSPDQVRHVEDYNHDLLETVRWLPGEISARQAENRDTPRHRAGQH